MHLDTSADVSISPYVIRCFIVNIANSGIKILSPHLLARRTVVTDRPYVIASRGRNKCKNYKIIHSTLLSYLQVINTIIKALHQPRRDRFVNARE